MKVMILPVLAGVVLLAGCAGGKSSFDCGATAGDQCMTMQQANEKAGMLTDAKRGRGAKQLPAVAERAPSVTATQPGASLGVVVPAVTSGTSAGVVVPPVTSGTGKVTSATASYTTPLRPVVRPLRVAEGTGKIWVAAWVDKDGAYHADNMISVVTRPGEWN